MRLFAVALIICSGLFAGDLGGFKTVYLLPMSGGLDQFLATRLTSAGVLQVVTDPKKADVVFTDRIGAGFEDKLNELYGEQPKVSDKDDLSKAPKPIDASISRGRGLIFMVDRRTREVVWSAYLKPKDTTPNELNRVAGEIVSKLEKDRKGKPESK